MEAKTNLQICSSHWTRCLSRTRQLAAIQQQMTAEITSLWQTEEVRRQAPSVFDEIQMGLDYSRVLLETMPGLYDFMAQEVLTNMGCSCRIALPAADLEFGSWIGGDQDGNPHVNPECTEIAL